MFVWLNGNDTTPPILLDVRSSRAFIMSCVGLAVFTDIFLYALMTPIIPFELQERIGMDPSMQQIWTSVLLAVYGGALLVSSPFCAWYSDRCSSPQVCMVIGLILSACATLLLSMSSSIALLLLGRVAQGCSGGVVWVAGLALIARNVPKTEIGRYSGYVGLAMSAATMTSPVISGTVLQRSGYHAVFAVPFALVFMDAILRVLLIERQGALQWHPKHEHRRPDSLETLEIPELVLPPLRFSIHLFPDPLHDHTGMCTLPYQEEAPLNEKEAQEERVSQESFEKLEQDNQRKPSRSSRLPVIIQLLGSSRLVVALYGCLVQGILITSLESLLPIRVEYLFSWGPTGAGLIFLPLTIPALTSPGIGWISDRYGARG